MKTRWFDHDIHVWQEGEEWWLFVTGVEKEGPFSGEKEALDWAEDHIRENIKDWYRGYEPEEVTK